MAKTRGRPSSYNTKVADQICGHIASGKSLRSFCAIKGSPNRATIWRWLETRQDFRIRYARAREDQVEAFVDGLLEICDDPTLDPNDKRIRVDTRKWIAARILPKKYGDRVATELTGRDGGPIEIENTGSDLEAARRVAFMLGRAVGRQDTPLLTNDVFCKELPDTDPDKSST